MCVLIIHRSLPLENCPEMTVTLGRMLPDSGEQERKLTTKVCLSCVHSPFSMICLDPAAVEIDS